MHSVIPPGSAQVILREITSSSFCAWQSSAYWRPFRSLCVCVCVCVCLTTSGKAIILVAPNTSIIVALITLCAKSHPNELPIDINLMKQGGAHQQHPEQCLQPNRCSVHNYWLIILVSDYNFLAFSVKPLVAGVERTLTMVVSGVWGWELAGRGAHFSCTPLLQIITMCMH